MGFEMGFLAMSTVFERLEAHLRAVGVDFTVLQHAPVFTSEEAAAIRGTPLASGAKALVMKVGDDFVMLVLPADRKVESKKVRTAFGVKSLRFASREEVERLTGLQPGSIPPFGSLFGLPTACDPALGDNASINFNAGDHAISIQMSFADWCAVEKPRLEALTEQGERGA
jgi:Ala-tRNA(Pro) deacylase